MSLKKAVPFLRAVAKTTSNAGGSSQYTFHDGYCYAQNPAILAAYPTPHILGTFGLAAADLEAAINRMGDEPRVTAGDETLILTCGRLRSNIKVFEASVPSHSVDLSSTELLDAPVGLGAALRKAALFVSSRGTWQTSVRLAGDLVTAFNDRSAVEVKVEGLDVPDPISLPDSCVRYLDDLEDPDKYQLFANAALFFWSSAGAWVRCQLSVFDWPKDVIERVFSVATSSEAPPIELTQEWKDAFGDVVALSDDYALVGPGGVKGVAENSTHEVEFSTGLAEERRWSIAVVKQLMVAADSWAPATSGPTLFRGPDCRGVVMHQRR